MKPNKKDLYQSIDDIFENGMVSKELCYNDISFYGCIEFSPLLSQKRNLDFQLPLNLNLNTHLHLFVRNRTGLSSRKVIKEFQFQKGENKWIDNIERILDPKECNLDFYNINEFINYHVKQPYLEKRIIHS